MLSNYQNKHEAHLKKKKKSFSGSIFWGSSFIFIKHIWGHFVLCSNQGLIHAIFAQSCFSVGSILSQTNNRRAVKSAGKPVSVPVSLHDNLSQQLPDWFCSTKALWLLVACFPSLWIAACNIDLALYHRGLQCKYHTSGLWLHNTQR